VGVAYLTHDLVGYNINDHRLKAKVLQAVQGLRRPEKVYRECVVPYLLLLSAYCTALRYVEAPHWLGLTNVFTKSLSGSTMDEMILLLQTRGQKFKLSFARSVIYGNIEEILDRLRAKGGGHTDQRGPGASSLDFPISEVRQAEAADDGQQTQPALPEEDVLNRKGGELAVDNGSQEETTASPEEIQAALTIASAYHCVITRRKEVLKGVGARRARLWSLLRNRVLSMEWSRYKRYKLLMQGPLVHILVCLDGIKMFADYVSKDTKKQLRGDDHSKLEELIEKSDRSRYNQRAISLHWNPT
jgi:hypothetical protein